MAKLWKKISDADNKVQLQELAADNLSLTKPTVIYLSGILTTDGNAPSILSGIDDVEKLLEGRKELREQPEVWALSHKNLKNIFNIFAYNLNPEKACSRAAKDMAQLLILPMVAAAGKPLPFEQAAENLRKLTLVAYSAGSVFAQEMFNASLRLMKKCGYDDRAARKLLEEVVLISMANVSRPTKERERFTTLYLAGSDDIAVRLKNRLLRPLGKIFSRYNGALAIRSVSKNALLITGEIAKTMWQWRDKPDGTQEKTEIPPLFPKNWLFRSHHEIEHYTTSDANHNPMAKFVLNALVNAVNRRQRTEVARLLEPVTAKDAAEVHSYRQRIAAALGNKSRVKPCRKPASPAAGNFMPQNALAF